MGQYKQSEGTIGLGEKPTTVTPEAKQIQSVESTVKQLQEVVGTQQQEILRLHRDINRLKNQVDDVIAMVRSRG